jgi:heme/copper-type cytochrome/quinol oxidase subunit 3
MGVVHDDVRVDMVALYWHFVDIVWILIFTIVYLVDAG